MRENDYPPRNLCGAKPSFIMRAKKLILKEQKPSNQIFSYYLTLLKHTLYTIKAIPVNPKGKQS